MKMKILDLEDNWMKQTNWEFIKYVIHHRHSMTHEQLKQKPFKEIFKKQHENLDTEEGESNEEEEEFTTSSEMSKQDSESDTSTQDKEASEPTQTFQTHNVVNETTHDEENSSETEDDTPEDENVTEMQTSNFEVKVENRKVEGLITYSKVNSGTDQEVLGVYIDFQSIHSKWTIDTILQHMGFM